MATELTLGTDFGPFVLNGQCPIPFADFITQLDCKFFIGQGGFAENVAEGYSTKINLAAARSAGIELVGEYYWLDAGDNIQATIDRISRDIDANNPDFCEYDLEQSSDENGKLYDPKLIADFTEGVVDGTRSHFPERQHELYSRTGFVSQFAAPLLPWVATQDLPWWAANPDWGLETYTLSYEDIKAGKIKIVTNYNTKPVQWVWGNVYDAGMGPDMFYSPEADGWMWQTGGRRKPLEVLNNPYYNHTYDFDYWRGNFESMKAWVKKSAPVIVPPTPVLTLEILDARLKAVEADIAKIKTIPIYQQHFPVTL
jgi:hypothetical protein